MLVSRHGSLKRITIDPGEYYVSNEPLIISTLLGSCVSACLWDPLNRVVGMNHFLLANSRYTQQGPVLKSDAGRYGIHAMELLINAMLRLGANKRQLRAKAFGGGNVIYNQSNKDNFFAVGEVNSRFIREFLSGEGIPLQVAHLGGDFGRVIHFTSTDYSVYMKTIGGENEQKIMQAERRYWKHEIEEHEKIEHAPKNTVQYW